MPTSNTKYRGSALWAAWYPSTGGTVDIIGDSRTFEVKEESNQIDVTVRADTAKRFLTDYPSISVDVKGLDGSGTVLATNQPWDSLTIGQSGTLVWGPEGTVTSYRKRTLVAIVKSKTFSSPYDGVVEWGLSFDSNGGTIVVATW